MLNSSKIGKIVDGELKIPSEYERKKIIVTNPTDEQLKLILDYKSMIVDQEPEYDIETQYLSFNYEETESFIFVHWEIHNIDEEIFNETEN